MVVMDVVPDPVHPAIVVVTQLVCVTVATVATLVPPDTNDVENETVSVHDGIAVLPVHEEEEAELVAVLDDPCVEDGWLSSSSRSLPISARVSVKFSTRSISGVSPSTVSAKLLTTFRAQLTSLETSLIAPLIAPATPSIMLLSLSKALNCLSDNVCAFLFLFVFEQSGISGLLFRLSNKAAASSCVCLTSSRNWDLSLSSVSHLLLAWSAKNRPPRNTASDVAASSDIVVVGILNHVKSTGVGFVVSVHEPLHVYRLVEDAEDKDEEPVEVGKGRVPFPGIAVDDCEDDDEDADPEAEPVELVLLVPFFEIVWLEALEREPETDLL